MSAPRKPTLRWLEAQERKIVAQERKVAELEIKLSDAKQKLYRLQNERAVT